MCLITNKMSYDRIIQTATKKYNIRRMVNVPGTFGDLYFFFSQEKQDGPKHHAIPSKNKIFDYIDMVYYDTLEQWAVTYGRTLNDVVYGQATFLGEKTWVSIDSLMRSIKPDWVAPTAEEKCDDNRMKICADINSNLLVARNYLNHVEYLMKKL